MVPTGDASLLRVADALRGANRITAICHENPDADTIGAAIAVALIGQRLGKQVEVVSIDRPAPAFDFLPLIDQVGNRPGLEPDLAVVCDAASLERVGRIVNEEAEWFEQASLVNIDHHVTNTGFGDFQLVDATAAATCQVVVRLVDELGVALDSELATALLTGIVRDTQGFAEPSTGAETLRTTARLVEAGARLAFIQRRLLSELPYPALALWGRMLARIGQAADGRIVYTTLTRSMLDETGAEQHDADGLAEFIATARQAQVAILLRELGAAETRVSIRTTPAIDATLIASAFNGGGHARRSGCTLPLPVDEAAARVISAATEVLRSAPSTVD